MKEKHYETAVQEVEEIIIDSTTEEEAFQEIVNWLQENLEFLNDPEELEELLG